MLRYVAALVGTSTLLYLSVKCLKSPSLCEGSADQTKNDTSILNVIQSCYEKFFRLAAAVIEEIKKKKKRGNLTNPSLFQRCCEYVASHQTTFALSDALYFYGCYKTAYAAVLVGTPKQCQLPKPGDLHAKTDAIEAFSGIESDVAKYLYTEHLLALRPEIRLGLLLHPPYSKKHELFSDGFKMPPSTSVLEVIKDPTTTDHVEVPPLIKAISCGDVATACELIQSGSQPISDCIDASLTSPLHLAADRGLNQVVECLVAAGASLDAQEANLETPLHVAIIAERLSTAQKLLDLGCDPTIKNSDGEDCYSLARKSERCCSLRFSKRN